MKGYTSKPSMVKNGSTRKIKKYFNLNENKNMTSKFVYVAKAELREMFTALLLML